MEADRSETEFREAVLRNAFNLWFEPEIARRQEAGTLPTPFKLWAAQVILDLEQPPVINFNEQVAGLLTAEIEGGGEVGQTISFDKLEGLMGLELTDAHPNAGHLTAVVHHKKWYLFFDFRYNAARVERYLAVARQFIATAEDAYSRQDLNACIENLFAAVELMAKSLLLFQPDRRLLEKTRHRFVSTEFNRHGSYGNVPEVFVKLLNTLSGKRNNARFPDEPLSSDAEEVGEWLRTAREMEAHLERVRPTRASLPEGGAADLA